MHEGAGEHQRQQGGQQQALPALALAQQRQAERHHAGHDQQAQGIGACVLRLVEPEQRAGRDGGAEQPRRQAERGPGSRDEHHDRAAGGEGAE